MNISTVLVLALSIWASVSSFARDAKPYKESIPVDAPCYVLPSFETSDIPCGSDNAATSHSFCTYSYTYRTLQNVKHLFFDAQGALAATETAVLSETFSKDYSVRNGNVGAGTWINTDTARLRIQTQINMLKKSLRAFECETAKSGD